MFPCKNATSSAAAAAAVAAALSSNDRQAMCVQGDSSGSGLVLATDPKPRLRWTVELHERFVDAVTQLGGLSDVEATPETIMRVMGVRGLDLDHIKCHLQKFTLGKQPLKEFNEHSVNDADGDYKPENKDIGDEYREFDTNDPNYQQEFVEDADGAPDESRDASKDCIILDRPDGPTHSYNDFSKEGQL